VPHDRTIYRTVEKCPTTDSGWGKTKQNKKKCYILTAGGEGEVKKSAAQGKTKLLKLQPYKLTVVQLFLPGL
jgi:hypothetical protein